MVGGGVAWMVGMSTLSIAAQQAAPSWVRARALAVSLLVIQGSLALGSLAAGALADTGRHVHTRWRRSPWP